MLLKDLYQDLRAAGLDTNASEPLCGYTSFKIGGNADLLVKPHDEQALSLCVKLAKQHKAEYFILGKGSNLLVSDAGYRGLIISTEQLCGISLQSDEEILCGSGVSLQKLCGFARDHSLAGLEFAWGIPGSVGGGVYMNAGAYGGEIKDVLVFCRYMDEMGKIHEIGAAEMALSYRHSFFSGKNMVVLSVLFGLHKDKREEITARMDNYMNRRKTKQPLESPSCGSTFKRPANGYASALIDECGLRGKRVGDAQVSEKHAGFIINRGHATCADVLALIETVQRTVLEKTGVALECEVKTLGV